MRYEIEISFISGTTYKHYYDDRDHAVEQYVLMYKSMREKSILYSKDRIIDFSKVEMITFNELEEL